MARTGCRTLVSSSSSMVEPLVKWMVAGGAEQTLTRNWAFSFSSPSSVFHSSRCFHAKREKKHVDRVSAAVEAVHERKLPPELRGKSKAAVRSETEILNVVEQRIWHSMEEGQFENLPGKGKPLNCSANPHADPAEDTLFRILSKNGCAPEWVELNKEIRSKIKEWRAALKKAWATRSNEDDPKWIEFSDVLKVQMHDINNKVFRYNLIVPFGRQMFGLKWEKEMSQVEG